MAGSSPSLRGTRGELLFAAAVIDHGGIASIPAGHGQSYDIIADFDGSLARVQVKVAYYTEARDRWDLGIYETSVAYEGGRRRQTKHPISGQHYEVLAAMVGAEWYLIPSRLLIGRSHLVFRPEGCRPRPNGGVRPEFETADYREAWHMFDGGPK